ncbi:hypothetical protein quinque_015884 [Culex quinquefasciatus]
MILLDVEKAYDSVWQDAVVYKLFRSNLQPFLVKIIQFGQGLYVRVLYQRQLLGTLMTNSVPKATENIRITFNSQVLRIVRERGPTYDIYLYQTYRGRNVTDQYSNGKPDLWLPDYQTIPSLIKH